MATVLLVDDMLSARALLKIYLAELQPRILEATDGRAALATARTERPDVVISDLQMPRMSGLELVEAMRAEPGLERTPVILLTATTDHGAPAALDARTFFAEKPIRPEALRDLVRQALVLRDPA